MDLNDEVHDQIVTNLADDVTQKLVRRCIRALQQRTDCLSGDNSELANAWDEVCVQVQYERSFYWYAYDQMVRTVAEDVACQLKKHEEMAIWLQTDDGSDWLEENEAHRPPQPYLVDYLADRIYEQAGRWSNSRIRAFLGE